MYSDFYLHICQLVRGIGFELKISHSKFNQPHAVEFPAVPKTSTGSALTEHKTANCKYDKVLIRPSSQFPVCTKAVDDYAVDWCLFKLQTVEPINSPKNAVEKFVIAVA